MKNLTPNMNDRELEDLFRKAAAEYSPVGKEKVWKKLEEKLDAPPSSKDRRKPAWWIFLPIFLLAILGFLAWHYYGTNSEKQVQQPVTNISEINKKGDLPSTQKVKPEKKYDPPSAEKKAASASAPSSGMATASPAFHFKDNGSKVANETASSHEFKTSLFPLEKLPAQSRGIFQQKLAIQIPEEQYLHFDTAFHFFKKNTAAKTEAASEEKQNLSTKKTPRWYFGLTAGPDWSSAAGKGWKTGIGGGLKLTYRLNRKWAFSTGVLLDKKLYDARPGDYNPVDDSWQNYDVKSINARCTVWDVPLNVEYTIWDNEKNHIFLSTGLSSFWMHEEEYTYYYKTSSGDWREWSKEMYNKNHHIFSILNFSAGYERSWKHFSLQAQPYLKVPLKGVGYGRVKLYSTGIHFTLQYGLK